MLLRDAHSSHCVAAEIVSAAIAAGKYVTEEEVGIHVGVVD
jgi:hypothetical protein